MRICRDRKFNRFNETISRFIEMNLFDYYYRVKELRHYQRNSPINDCQNY